MNTNPCADVAVVGAYNYAAALMSDGKTIEEAYGHAFQRFGVTRDFLVAEHERRLRLRGTPPVVGVVSTPSSAAGIV